jgi:hypothetical protein
MRNLYSPIFISFLILLCFWVDKANGQTCDAEMLMRDLLTVSQVDEHLNERVPVGYNFLQQGGYIIMPSGRMGEEGEIGFGYASVPPFRVYSARCQYFSNIELSGNYRIFSGIDDPVFGHMGFGEQADKGANIKFALWRPEDSRYFLPGIAVGIDDVIGTRAFNGRYVVLTQVWPKYNFEFSVGYGAKRIKQWFGGISWMPFRKSGLSLLEPLSFVAEYDATDYRHDPHPDGRDRKTHINFGVKYRAWNYIDLTASCIRGNHFSFAGSIFYNFGETCGFQPKVDDPLPYISPINTEQLGCLRPEDVMVNDFYYVFWDQGFDLSEVWISFNECGEKVLRLSVYNAAYRNIWDVRRRLNYILASLTPSDIEYVYITMLAEGFPIQEYHYNMAFVRAFSDQSIGARELNLLTPQCEVSYPDPCCSQRLFKENREILCYEILPRTQTFFGSSKGKFKYALGIDAAFNGFLYDDIYYDMLVGYTAFTSIKDTRDVDILNPSQLLNVHSDVTRYYKQRALTCERLYLQRSWNLGRGFYSRLSGGWFEIEWGGTALEALYYPVNSCWAIGAEAAILWKRKVLGLGFTNTIRKMDGFIPTYVRNFTGSQAFVDFYYDLIPCQLNFKVALGKFLANDFGARFEVCRYFDSGLQISFWYTRTNAHDKINGETYYDKGFAISMPLDIFYSYSSRERFGYAMSAWLRDCGYRSCTGTRLYDSIHDQRY